MAAPNQNDARRERDDPGFFEKSMEDRVAATTEDVDHLLDPDRTPETVRYPDPDPAGRDGGAPDSMADVEMARRTDAGNYRPADPVAPSQARGFMGIGIAVAILVVLVIAFAFV